MAADANEPVVISSEFMKDCKPIKMVSTDQATFQDPGWKLLTGKRERRGKELSQVFAGRAIDSSTRDKGCAPMGVEGGKRG